MESPKQNEKKDDSSYLFLHNLLNSISKNIWKNKYIGYAFLVGINGLFFISYFKDMNLLSLLSSLLLFYLIVSIIIVKLNYSNVELKE
jgi:hypothetical protein